MLFFWKSLHMWGHKYHRAMYLNISLNFFSVLNPFWSFFGQYLPKNAVFGGFLVHPGFFFNGTGLPQIWILISRAHTHKNPVLSQFWEIESIFVKSQDSLPMGLQYNRLKSVLMTHPCPKPPRRKTEVTWPGTPVLGYNMLLGSQKNKRQNILLGKFLKNAFFWIWL